MRNTYDKLEGIKYTSDNGNPYWYLSSINREFGINIIMDNQIPGHCIKMHTNGKIGYVLSLKGLYVIAECLDIDEIKAYLLGYGDYDRIVMVYEYLLRIRYREILKDKDKDLNSYIKRNVGASKIPLVKSGADKGLFDMYTNEVKSKYRIRTNESLYDYFSSTLLMARITAIKNMLKYNDPGSSVKVLFENINFNERRFLLGHYIEPINELSLVHINDAFKQVNSYKLALDKYHIAFCPFALPN